MKSWNPAPWSAAFAVILALFQAATPGFAQPTCAIQIDNDTTICQGQNVVLHGPSGYANHTWSTGASTQDITVGSTGTYWCQVSYPSPQLVTNGNFTSGNTGFSTGFTYSTTLTTDGNYWIGTNAALYHPQFSGTGNGNFMILNSGWPSALFMVWCQDVVVCPGQTYTLSYRARTLSNAQPARLQWWIDGTATVGPEVTLPLFANGWQTITQTWTTGPNQTAANICLRAMSGDGIGNDIGLDDISLQGTIVLRDSVDVTVTPLPSFDLGPTATLCTGQNLVLDAAVPGGTYVWQDGSTASSFTATGPGNYNVTVTANNCSASDAITVNYNTTPVVDLGADTVLCTGQTLLLDVTTLGATYTWQDNTGGPTFLVSGPGTYSVTVLRNNCFDTDAVDVTYNTTPAVDLGSDLTFCAGDQGVFDATTAGATYLWDDGSTDPTLTVTAAGPYTVEVTVNGCSATDVANVIVTPLPVVDLGLDQTVCPGTIVTLDATTAGGTYVWSDGTTNPTLSTSTPGTYSVEVTVDNCSSTDDVDIANHVVPVFDIGPDQTICAGIASASFSANVAGATYAWNTGAVGNSIQPTTAGIYWLDVTTNGCTVRDSAEVFVTPLPVFSLGNDVSVCPGNTVLLDATTTNATYLWNTGVQTATISTGVGSYSVTVTVDGCPATDAIDVGAFPAAAVSLGNDTTLCPGQQLTLNVAQAGASYVWQDGSVASTYTATTAGPVSVVLTDANGCTANDAMNVAFAAPTAVDLGVDTTICQGAPLLLDATVAGATYLWNTGAQTATINVTNNGLYSVVVTQGSCTVNDAINIATTPLPVVDLGLDQTLCTGDVIVLDANTTGSTYLWNTGAQTPTINVTTGGTYSVTLTNAAGCTASNAIDIIEATPDAIDLGADVTLCQGGTATLDATLPGATYVWSSGTTSNALIVGSAGTYWVEATQGNCVVSDTVDVIVNPVPTVSLGNNLTLCAGEDTLLNATYAGATYLWNTGAQTPTLNVSTAGTYSVTLDLNGCTATDAIDIAVLDLGAIDLGADVTLCAGETVSFDATLPGVTHLWSTGVGTPTITTGTAGTYWVQATQGNCAVSDTVDVIVNPVPTVNLGNNLTLCLGEDTLLNATYAGATYLWNTGAQTPTLNVSTAGTYSVTLYLNGCMATDAIDVAVLTPNAFDLGPDIQLCVGEQVVFVPGVPNASYLWSTGATTTTLSVNTTATVWVQISQGVCATSDTVDVNVLDPGSMDLGTDIIACAGTPVLLDATVPNGSYVWNTGATSAQLPVISSGPYSVTVTVGQCTITDQIDVTIVPLPIVEIGGDQDICPGFTAGFDASTPGASYVWHDGSTASNYATSTAEPVSVTVTVDGCSASDGAQVIVLAAPAVDLGNDTTICEGASFLLDVTQTGASYAWNTGSLASSLSVTTPGSYQVTVDLNGCTATDAIDVGVFAPSTLDLGVDQLLCPDQTATLNTGINGQHTWSTGATAGAITVSTAGDYWVQVQVAACVVSDTVTIDYVPLATPDLGDNLLLCMGDTVMLGVVPGAAAVQWSTGSSADSITVASSGNYGVVLSLQGCTTTDALQVLVLERVDTLSLGVDSTYCPERPLVLDATIPGASYVWNTGASTSSITVDMPGTYSVHATGLCIDAATTINVVEGTCDPLVYVPNSFTPNGDGVNEVFQVSVYGQLRDFSLWIFDRWGERIHTSDNPVGIWDGTYNGEVVPDGVYVWKVRYRTMTDGGAVSRELIGHVTVLR